MPLGTCPTCEKLVAITPGKLIPGRGREREWVPAPHSPATHARCGGAIVVGECARCGLALDRIPVDDVLAARLCAGKAIR